MTSNPSVTLLERLSTPLVVVLSGAVSLGLMVTLFSLAGETLPEGAPSVIELQLTLSAEEFADILAQWGGEAVAAYRAGMWIDFVYPVAYALFLSTLLIWVGRGLWDPVPRFLRLAAVLPWLAGLLDWVENSLHLVLLRSPEDLSQGLVTAAGVVAWVKWSLALVVLLVILQLAVLRLLRALYEG